MGIAPRREVIARPEAHLAMAPIARGLPLHRNIIPLAQPANRILHRVDPFRGQHVARVLALVDLAEGSQKSFHTYLTKSTRHPTLNLQSSIPHPSARVSY